MDITLETIMLPMSQRQIPSVAVMDSACFFLRVCRPYGCFPTHAGSPEGERMELFDGGGEGEAGGLHCNHHLLVLSERGLIL